MFEVNFVYFGVQPQSEEDKKRQDPKLWTSLHRVKWNNASKK